MTLIAGVDSSTQSCKVLIRELETGKILRSGTAKHPDGTEVDPERWFEALLAAIEEAGGFGDVSAVSIAAQQHGMVALKSTGEVIRPALLWNDTRSAPSADSLVREFGAANLVDRTGSAPVASFTITKLHWLRENEPQNAAEVAAIALPHDWLTWRLRGYGPAGDSELGPVLDELVTDRSDASGTGYFNSVTNEYDRELLIAALGHDAVLPRVLGESEYVVSAQGIRFAAGAGDNAAAALGLGLRVGDVAISIGTSGTVFASSATPARDHTGTIAGFADATGHYLPIAVTLNAARVLKSGADLLGVDFDEFSKLALSAEPGAGGVSLTPYFEGERTPNLPNATATLSGLTLQNATRQNFARAHVEGMLEGLAYGLSALVEQGVKAERILLIGGGAQSQAVQEIAAQVFKKPVHVPEISEYVAEGATVQAAWALTGIRPDWQPRIAASF